MRGRGCGIGVRERSSRSYRVAAALLGMGKVPQQ